MRNIDEIDYPRDAEEWWALAEANKEDLLQLVRKFHPYYKKKHDHKITARKAENYAQIVRDDIAKEYSKGIPTDPADLVENCFTKAGREVTDLSANTLVGILNETWMGMPEAFSVRSEPGFNVLCDLCSECHVLEEQQHL